MKRDRAVSKPQLHALIELARPKQWVKNVFIFAALIFSGKLFVYASFFSTVLVFLAFCMLSSAAYILNDVVDVGADSVHPRKRYRPLPSGRISVSWGIAAGVVLVLAALSIGVFEGYPVLLIEMSYLAVNVLYSFWLKKKFLIDVLSVSACFLLRVLAGAAVVGVFVSPWLGVLVTFLSLFLALGKRRTELVLLGDRAKDHKQVLATYCVPLLDQYLNILVSTILVTYTLYTFFVTARDHLMMTTLPFVIYGLFRYMHLLHTADKQYNVDELLFSDLPLLIDLGLWLLSDLIILYARAKLW